MMVDVRMKTNNTKTTQRLNIQPRNQFKMVGSVVD